MQRFIGPLVVIVVVFFGLNWIISSQTGTDLISVLRGNPTASPTATQPTAPLASPDDEEPAGEDPTPSEDSQSENPAAEPSPAKAALTALDNVDVTPATRIPEYNRKSQFTPDGKGTSWPDVDGNGCNTRDDILARDLTNTTRNEKCQVTTGVLNDPYTGKAINFERDITVDGKKVGGDSMAVQIDHKYPLAKFWAGGAWEWTQDERVAAANDPLNLIASDGPANNLKSAKGPSEWMPSTAGNAAYDCTFATDVVTILVKYDLTAPKADIDALRSTLAACN